MPVLQEKETAVSARQDSGDGRFMSGDDRHRLFALINICLFVVMFWIAYEQQGNTLALWADENTDRHIGGWEIPATLFQSLNPLFIFLCTPLVTRLWAWQSRRGREPDSIFKMAVGCVLLGISFFIMIPAAGLFMMDGIPVSMWWLVASTLVLTIGELYLSPIGLSLVTKLAPSHMISMMMGVWFLSEFAGSFLAGYIGSFWDVMTKTHFFGMLGILGIATGMGILLYRRRLKRGDGDLICRL